MLCGGAPSRMQCGKPVRRGHTAITPLSSPAFEEINYHNTDSETNVQKKKRFLAPHQERRAELGTPNLAHGYEEGFCVCVHACVRFTAMKQWGKTSRAFECSLFLTLMGIYNITMMPTHNVVVHCLFIHFVSFTVWNCENTAPSFSR